jgi:hypothetical protein
VGAQETALLAIGGLQTALMSASIILALVFVYRTEVSNGRNTIVGLGVVFALIATWICASFEARLRAKTGSPIGE